MTNELNTETIVAFDDAEIKALLSDGWIYCKEIPFACDWSSEPRWVKFTIETCYAKIEKLGDHYRINDMGDCRGFASLDDAMGSLSEQPTEK